MMMPTKLPDNMNRQGDFLSSFFPFFKDKNPQKMTRKNWLDTEEPQVMLFLGQRGSGKGVAIDHTAEKLYHSGITILHIFAARSFENLYWAINKNCKKHYSKMKVIADAFYDKKSLALRSRCLQHMHGTEFDYYLDLMIRSGMIKKLKEGDEGFPEHSFELLKRGQLLHAERLLHCNCHKSYPIIWVVPDYVDIDKHSLNKFNNQYWSGIKEYSQWFKEITTEEKELLLKKRLQKPCGIAPKEMITVRQVTPPTTTQRRDVFRQQFLDIVLDARKEHRIVVCNPAIFESASEKFSTFAEMIKMVTWMMSKSHHFLPLNESDVGKPHSEWNKWQRNWHKIAVVINEVRSVAPSSRLSGETESSKSKRVLFDFVPEARHYRTWLLLDLQSPDDLYAGIRHQANLSIVKRASRNILSSDFGWLFEKVEKDRIGLLRKQGIRIEHPDQVWGHERDANIKKYLDDRRPRIGALPDNVGYVTYPNNEIQRHSFEMPSFHHKTSMESFQSDTGIRWSINKIMQPSPDQDTDSHKTIGNKKTSREKIIKTIHRLKTEKNLTYEQILAELQRLEKNEDISDMCKFASKDQAYVNNFYLRWRDRIIQPGKDKNTK